MSKKKNTGCLYLMFVFPIKASIYILLACAAIYVLFCTVGALFLIIGIILGLCIIVEVVAWIFKVAFNKSIPLVEKINGWVWNKAHIKKDETTKQQDASSPSDSAAKREQDMSQNDIERYAVMRNAYLEKQDKAERYSDSIAQGDLHLGQVKKPSLRNNESELLVSIKNFWCKTKPDYSIKIYRTPTREEFYEYAKADVLSCFEKVRTNESFSVFHLSQINVTNWNIFFNELYRDEYLRKATAVETLFSYKVTDLKIIAESIGVKKSGRKADIIDRICDELSDRDLESIAERENLFIISEKGKQYLLENYDYSLLRTHSTFDVSLAEFNDERIIGGRKRNFYDTMFQVLNKQYRYYQVSHQYSMVGVTSYRIYSIMMEESSRTTHNVPMDVALSYYLKHLYLATCFPMDACNIAHGTVLSYFEHFSLPDVSELNKFQDYKDMINFKAIFYDAPPSFLMQNEFIDLINEIFTVSLFDSQKWNTLLRKRLYEYSKLFT